MKSWEGKPLLHEDVYTLMDYLIESNLSENMKLIFNTNMTTMKDEFLEKLNHFKKIKVNMSVDGCGNRDEYIRYPSKWENIKRNISIISDMKPDNTILCISTVFQNLGVMGFGELEHWIDEKGVDQHFYIRLQWPRFLRSNVLPDSIKDKVCNLLSDSKRENARPLLTDMMQPYTEEEKTEFIEYIKKKDKLRGVKILDYCPEFEEWF